MPEVINIGGVLYQGSYFPSSKITEQYKLLENQILILKINISQHVQLPPKMDNQHSFI